MMSERLPMLYLARHGETAWSLSGQHTGLTDLPLTARGEEDARRLGERLKGIAFDKVFTSPLQRAKRTCEYAGFGPTAEVDPDLVEWDYGSYEGLKTTEILERQPGWELFRDGCPGGESPAAVTLRVDRVLDRFRAVGGDMLLFSSGHLLRVLAARWLGLDAGFGRCLFLGTSAVCILGYEHNKTEPVIRLWNDIRYPNQ